MKNKVFWIMGIILTALLIIVGRNINKDSRKDHDLNGIRQANQQYTTENYESYSDGNGEPVDSNDIIQSETGEVLILNEEK